MEKYDLITVKAIVENEGLGYAIQHYMSGEHIADEKLASLWDQADRLLNEISSMLHLE